MIYSNIDFVDFENAFRRYGRMDNFPNTLPYLFEYLDDLSNELENGIELDVITICCEFSEYDMDELKQAYSHLIDADSELEPESDEFSKEFIEALSCEVMLIDCDNGYFLVQE